MFVRISCASYLLFVPGTTRNFPPGEAGGENVFSSVADEAQSPMAKLILCYCLSWRSNLTWLAAATGIVEAVDNPLHKCVVVFIIIIIQEKKKKKKIINIK